MLCLLYQHEPVNLLAGPDLISLFFLQNAIVSFKELCGLSAVANLKQCILALSPRLTGPDNSPLLVFNLIDQYPNLEPQGLLPEVLKKVVTTYDMVSSSSKELFPFICIAIKPRSDISSCIRQITIINNRRGRDTNYWSV